MLTSLHAAPAFLQPRSFAGESRSRGTRAAFVAKYAFQLAQAFNLFYHNHHILTESDLAKKKFLLQLSCLVEVQLVAALELLGIESPEKM
jgi:arginyl-tRNA synthetase